jgi:hypothetical protein
MPYAHPSGLPKAYDRAAAGLLPNAGRMVMPEGRFVLGMNLNEMQRILERRGRRVGNLTAADGDRVAGAGVLIDTEAGTASLDAGSIYVRGDVRPVAAAVLEDVPMTGSTTIGIRLRTVLVDYPDDVTALGNEPGSYAEGEPGMAREDETIAWALPGDDGAGDYYPVYSLVDGVIIDQTEPPSLSGINAAIALYDRHAHGNYIVEGCQVTALGKLGSAQIFAVEAGTANIMGQKRTRDAALRHVETEAPTLETIVSETHTVTANPMVIETNRPAIHSVQLAVVTKTVTETVTRGSIAGGIDELAHASVSAIVSVTQGATTYTASTDFVLAGDAISWAPAGAEPVASSTYTVVYRYEDAVTPSAITDTTVTVAGGTIGQPARLSYKSKIPRTDILCLDSDGNTRYVPGIAARKGRLAPPAPTTLLKLAEIDNDWLGTPAIKNNGTTRVTYDMLWRRINQLELVVQQFSRANLASNVPDRVSARNVFIDHFADDGLRDAGEAQTAAIVGNTLQLAVDLIGVQQFVAEPITLAWTEAVLSLQPLRTSAMKINPYANFTRMAGGLKLEPPVYFAAEQATVWTSGETQNFGGSGQVLSTTVINEVVSERTEIGAFMPEVEVAYTITGFGAGEILEELTFDGVDITPDPALVANGAGQIVGTLTIPANVPAGARRVRAEGQAGSFASAIFVGQTTIEVDVMRRVTLVTRAEIREVSAGVVVPDSHSDSGDPLAQTFALDEARHVVGVNFWVAALGDPTRVVRVQMVATANGYPTTEILAEAVIDMSAVAVGDKIEARFAAPVFVSPNSFNAFVWMTDDAAHAISIARLGDVYVDPDTGRQTNVGAQPYIVGDLFSGSNSRSWLLDPNSDVAFEVVVADFAPTSRTVTLGTIDLDTISDLVVRGTAELPTEAATARFELVRASGEVVPLAAGQTLQFSSFVTETATLRAVLAGSAKVAPTLWPGVTVLTGRLRTTGTYVSRVWPLGSAVTVKALVEAFLPSGSSLTMAHDKADDTWLTMSPADTTALGNGWVETLFEGGEITATEGRLKLTLTGTPLSRPQIAQLRGYPW